jgi:hypothetical protein
MAKQVPNQTALISLFYAPRELHLLPQAGCYPYAKSVFGFGVIAAGGLDLDAGEEGGRLHGDVGHVVYSAIVRSP